MSANDARAAVGAYLAAAPLPFSVLLAPAAAPVCAEALALRGAPQGMSVRTFEVGRTILDGPTIVVLAPEDLHGPHREALARLARAALPGRSILVGGGQDRDILLHAINNWRVYRVVPTRTLPSGLLDALQKTYEAMQVEHGLERAATALREENARLEAALATLEETQGELLHAERLATLGRVTSGLIPVIAGYLGDLEEFRTVMGSRLGTTDPSIAELLGYAFTGVRTLNAMLDEIRGFAESRPESYRWEREDLDPLVNFAVSFGRFDPLSQQRVLHADLRSGAQIRGDCNRLYQVLINLLRNAFQATGTGGRIDVRTYVEGADAVIEVANQGDPIPAEVQARLFQPFFTTKGDRGIGLGLSLCRATIERHGGTITCTSAPGLPTCFRIRLPTAQEIDAA